MRREPSEPQLTVGGTVSLVVLAVGLTVTALDLPMAWLVWPLGYGVVLPLAIGYANFRRTDRNHQGETDPLADLKQRYVEGDIDEREFERRVEATIDGERGR